MMLAERSKKDERTRYASRGIADISIVTPSYDMLAFLPRCVASVADQVGMEVEHIIIDGGSTDGSVQWLNDLPGIIVRSEPDEGMYDALNKGLQMCTASIVAYLNCDEQYLPGTLARVQRVFEERPDVDIVFGNTILVDPAGMAVAFKKAYPLRWRYVVWSYLHVYSCAMFFRRSSLVGTAPFNTSYRAVADADLVVRLLKSGRRAYHIRDYLSAFTLTGSNLSWSEAGRRELLAFRSHQGVRRATGFGLVIELSRRFEQLAAGSLWEDMPLVYSIYEQGKLTRTQFTCENVPFSVHPERASRKLARGVIRILSKHAREYTHSDAGPDNE
jgi:glycosyltransferase involved in cell wall biosynthesis